MAPRLIAPALRQTTMRERPPNTWLNFANYVGLSPQLTQRCWQAIRASTWTNVVALRSTFLLHEELILGFQALSAENFR